MRSNKKHFSPGWILGISLGLASSGAVYAAGPITDTFTSGGTLTATQMNNIKNAVNDLQGNVPSTSCRTNAGAVDANAVRVGSLCVDKNLARADFTGCSADGITTCGSAIALNTGVGTATTNMSWAQAVRACANAGKRLLTPGEYMAAFISGSLLETATDSLEFVDSMLTLRSTTAATDPSSGGAASPAQGGYMGPRTASGGKVQMVTNVDYDATGFSFIVFRCVR